MLLPFCTELSRDHSEITIIAAKYRTLNRDGATLEHMLADAGHALKWSRRKTPPGSRLYVMGASFGGLLALDAVFADAKGVSGLILLNPVTNIAEGGFANRVVASSGRPEHSPIQRWREWGGMETLRCLAIHGSADDAVPIAATQDFCAVWPEGRCQFVGYPNVGHGFFNLPAHCRPVASRIHDFLSSEADMI